MPGKKWSFKSLLAGRGLSFTGLRLRADIKSIAVAAWGGDNAYRKDVCSQMQKLFTTMYEELQEYNDKIDILHLSYQDEFFEAIFRKVFWTRYMDKGDLSELIHYMIDSREQYLALPIKRSKREDDLARSIQDFMDLYQQRSKEEEKRALEAMELKKKPEALPEVTAQKEDAVDPTSQKKALPIRLKQEHMVRAPSGPFLVRKEKYKMLLAREKEKEKEKEKAMGGKVVAD
ncbi:hypothetical protein F4781DRAFT_435886 [Annulohypoxylon bovei var. microspora]|nr:hypothetical protein F4781DRAFT_435886 [Annulohypoxylon bovei var. microspora]